MLMTNFFILLILMKLEDAHQQNNEDVAMLIKAMHGVIKAENVRKNLNAILCWNKEKTNEFLGQTSNKYNTLINSEAIQPLKFLAEHQMFILDLNCLNADALLRTASELKLFRNPIKWILIANNSSNSINLQDYYFGVDSQIYLITGLTKNTIDIKTIYKQSKNATNLIEESFGQWNQKANQLERNKFGNSDRTDLFGTNIKISYVITHPDTINHLWDYRDKHIDAITKLNYILVNCLMDFLNATGEYIIQPTWGYKNQTTGIYSGMAGDLQTGIADLGGTPLFFTADRVDIIDYIATTTPTFMKFIFRAPPLSYVTNVYTLPFDATVWHYSFIMIAVIGVCVYIIVVWEWSEPEFRVKIEREHDSIRANVLDVLMMELGAVSQQGTDREPKSIAGRIATIFTFLILMFMYTSYSANIVALLQTTTDSIRTLEDLLHSRIKLGVDDIVYAHHYFETAQEPVRKAIYQQKIAPSGQKPSFMTIEEGIRKVQQGFFAFHVELSNGYKVVSDIFQESEKCGLQEIEYVNLIEPWVSTQKNSPYKEVMKIGLKKIVESGVRNREKNRIYSRKPGCLSTGSNFGSVGLIDCYSAFLIFSIGVVISITILLLELLVMKYIIRKTTHQTQFKIAQSF